MKNTAKLFSCLTAFSVLAGVPLLPAQAEAPAYTFTAEDVQRTYNTRFYWEFRNINMERIHEACEAGRGGIANAADAVSSYFAGVAFVWHGEGTPQGAAFGDFAPEWADKGDVNSYTFGETPKITTAEGYWHTFARFDAPGWPTPENERNYSWTEPTEITQAPETIYIAGAETLTENYAIDHCFDCAKTARALMADERVEVIGLMFGINTRPADWMTGIKISSAPEVCGGYLVGCDLLVGYNYSAEIIPIQHFGNTRGDLTGDGSITLEDVLCALEAYNSDLLGIAAPTAEQLEIADIDGDKVFDLTDVINILLYYNYNEVLGISASWEDAIVGELRSRLITNLETISRMLLGYIKENNIRGVNISVTFKEDTSGYIVMVRCDRSGGYTDEIGQQLADFIKENRIDPNCVQIEITD